MIEGTASGTLVAADGRAGRTTAWAWAPLAVGLFTLAVATTTIGRRSLSTDEAAALAQADRPLGDVLHTAIHDDPGQGGYLLLLKLISRAGTGEATIRIASAIAVALAAALLVVLGTRLLGRLGGLIAGAALGANAGVIDVAREARPYALGILGIVVSTLALAAALQRGGTGRWLAYGLFAVLLPLTHPLAASALLVHGAALLGSPGRSALWHRRTALVASGIAAAAAIILLGWMAADRIGSTDGTDTIGLAEFGGGAVRAFGWNPLLAAAAVAGLVALWSNRTRATARWQQALVSGLVLAPAAVSLVAATAMPVHALAALTLCAPGTALATGAAFELLPNRETLSVTLATLAAAAAVVLGIRITAEPAQDWRSLARAVERVHGVRESVVVVPDRSRAALAYYAPGLGTTAHARGDGAWIAVVADTPAEAIARARAAVHTPTYALLRQFRYGDGLRLQHWVRP